MSVASLFKSSAALLAHVTDCLQALHYSIHIRILRTSLNKQQNTLWGKLQEKHKGRSEKAWYCIDAGCSLKWVSCLKGKCPCLTRSRACGHYLPRLRRFLTLAEHGGPPKASKQRHLAHAGGMQWRRTGGASSVGGCHELECLHDGYWERLSQCDLGSCSPMVLPGAYLQGDGSVVR
jgi:hypothetical protein